jgi:hypothetical protein
MAEDNKHRPLSTELRPGDFGPYDPEYDPSGLPTMSAAQL